MRAAEFEVRLPLLATVGKAAEEAMTPLTQKSLANLRVLVVDDNRDAADSLGVWLSAMGVRGTCVTHGGRAALVALADQVPTSCYWTWACRMSMGSRWHDSCAPTGATTPRA